MQSIETEKALTNSSFDLDTVSLFSSVLLIEDEPAHAMIIKRALKNLVGEIEHVTTGEGALRALETNYFELVLSDLHLPDIDGMELIRTIRRARPDLPTIVMTASNNLDDAVAAMREGAWDYTVKHFEENLEGRLILAINRTAERKLQQMRELQARAERDAFWAATQTAQDGLAILGARGLVVFGNTTFRSFCTLLSGEEHGVSQSLNLVELISLVDKQVGIALKEQLEEKQGELLWSSELKVGRDESSQRFFELTLSSVKSVSLTELGGAPEARELRRFVVWVRDITRRKEQEKFQRDLLSTTTHDLKGPLGAILTSSELIQGNLKSEDPRVRDMVTRIASCARNSINLIDELLSARRIQDGVMVVRPQWQNGHELLDDTVLDYLPMAKAKNISLIAKPVDPLLRIWADRIGIHRVLGNLVSNAIKFTPKGGAVELSAKAIGDAVQITVADTGCGIESANRTALFDRYARLDKHQDVDGSGLGLYVTKNIVDAHSGHIELKSEVGKGSSFVITLPNQQDHIEADTL